MSLLINTKEKYKFVGKNRMKHQPILVIKKAKLSSFTWNNKDQENCQANTVKQKTENIITVLLFLFLIKIIIPNNKNIGSRQL